MLSLPAWVRIYVCDQPMDMRRGFDGLAAAVQEHLNEDPLSGHLYVFCNRRANRVKILFWEKDGFALYYKRLEQGTFALPASTSRGLVSLSQLTLMLEGVDAKGLKMRRRYHRPSISPAKP